MVAPEYLSYPFHFLSLPNVLGLNLPEFPNNVFQMTNHLVVLSSGGGTTETPILEVLMFSISILEHPDVQQPTTTTVFHYENAYHSDS